MDEQTKKWDFFIAHAGADKEAAEQLYDLLKTKCNVFLDMKSLKLGDNWDIELPKAQRQAHNTLALISSRAEDAFYLQEEIAVAIKLERADESRHRLIPIFLDKNAISEYGLNRKHHIEVPESGDLSGVAEQLLSLLSIHTQVRYVPEEFEEYELKYEDEVFAVAFSPDERWLAAGSDGCALVWDRSNLSESPIELSSFEDYVYAIAFSRDSKWLAMAGQAGRIRVWNIETQKIVWEQDEDQFSKHTDAIVSIAFSSDGSILATGSDDRHVKLWNSAAGYFKQERHTTARIGCIAFSPKETVIAIGSHDNTVSTWNYSTNIVNTVGTHHSSVESVAFSPDGLLLASGGLDKIVRLWEVGTENKMRWERTRHEYLVKSVAISPDGETVASAGWDKEIHLWDTSGDWYQKLPYSSAPWHEDWIWSVSFSPDGMTLASGGSDGRIMLWRRKIIK